MTETPVEKHLRVTTKFVMDHLKPTIGAGVSKAQSMAEMMVITESMLLGVMTILTDVYRLRPEDAATMMEGCLDQAMTRLGEGKN
jgi:hypothetical protein